MSDDLCCPACGYSLTGMPERGTCSECGTAYTEKTRVRPVPAWSWQLVAILVAPLALVACAYLLGQTWLTYRLPYWFVGFLVIVLSVTCVAGVPLFVVLLRRTLRRLRTQHRRRPLVNALIAASFLLLLVCAAHVILGLAVIVPGVGETPRVTDPTVIDYAVESNQRMVDSYEALAGGSCVMCHAGRRVDVAKFALENPAMCQQAHPGSPPAATGGFVAR